MTCFRLRFISHPDPRATRYLQPLLSHISDEPREGAGEKNPAKQTSKQIRLTLQQQPVKFSYRVFHLIPVHIFAVAIHGFTTIPPPQACILPVRPI